MNIIEGGYSEASHLPIFVLFPHGIFQIRSYSKEQWRITGDRNRSVETAYMGQNYVVKTGWGVGFFRQPETLGQGSEKPSRVIHLFASPGACTVIINVDKDQ